MKLIFACPTYGPTEPEADISRRVAIMHAASHGHEWLADASPNRWGWDVARNRVVDQAVNAKDADGNEYPDDAAIFWCDSDVVLPPDAIRRLADSGKEFVTGIYFQRRPAHMPLIAFYNGQLFNWITNWPDNVIAPIDGCGFGCVLTSLGMLRRMEAPWFAFKKFSEDFDFCLKAKALGYPLFVDTGVICGHLKDPEPAGIADFQRENPQFFIGGTDNGNIHDQRPKGDLAVLRD